MNNEEILKKVLEKYKISMPINPAVRKQIMKSRKKVLINIFKHYKQYNIVMAAALVVYYPLRQIGIKANLIQSAAIMFSISALTAICLLTGSYFAVKKIIFTVPAEKQIISEKLNRNENKPQPKEIIQIDKFENKIIFQGITSNTADKTIVNQLNAEIQKELYQIRGQGNIKNNAQDGKGIIIISSLEIIETKPEAIYLIMIKAVNIETSQILVIKEDSGKSSELIFKSVRIIKEIAENIK